MNGYEMRQRMLQHAFGCGSATKRRAESSYQHGYHREAGVVNIRLQSLLLNQIATFHASKPRIRSRSWVATMTVFPLPASRVSQ